MKPFLKNIAVKAEDIFPPTGNYGDTYAHIEAVTVTQRNESGQDVSTQISADGTQVRIGNCPDPRVRGSCVCISFFTEEGDRIYVAYQFHKGMCFRQVHQHPLDGSPSDLTELWRD